MSPSFLASPQVLVVEASAGSGKTYCLARRYVQLCLHLARTQSVPIQSILAITFTNKATWEMKSRILDFLKRIALEKLDEREESDILGPLGLDAQAASKLAFGLMDEVVRQYHYFQVQTIDSFVNILLVGCSFKIGLSANFRILHDARDHLQLSLDELLQQAVGDTQLRGLFEDFVRRYLYLENRLGWFPGEDLLQVVRELFRMHNTFQKPFLRHRPGDDIFAHKARICGLLRELKGLCPPQTTKRFLQNLEDVLASGDGMVDVDNLSAYFAREEFPVNKDGEVSPRLAALWRKVTAEIRELCLMESRGAFNPYVALFERIMGCFGRLSRRDDVLFLEELNRKAALLFEEGHVTVEELYFRLAARLEHYLVDEFQDTSVGQWRNLAPMVEEALAHGGSLFYVGDKKQAIYSFRGGESRLFDALQVHLSGFNLEVTALERNYRSCPEIIAFNNEVFSVENLKGFLRRRQEDAAAGGRREVGFSEDEVRKIEDTFAHSRQVPGTQLAGGMVRVYSLDGKVRGLRLEEARGRLVPLIRELKTRFALKDIAVLTRGNQELEEITQWLLEEGIDVSSERSSDIKNNELVGELTCLLSFLSLPDDNDAFARFCLGEMLPRASGLTPEVLREFLFECAQNARVNKGLRFWTQFRDKFPDVWSAFFDEALRRAGRCPLYELACGVVSRFGCERHFPGDQGFVMHWLELIKDHESESCDLVSFLSHYEKFEGEGRYVAMGAADAVTALTVHKAKGLEYPVVIVPFLEMDVKAGGRAANGGQPYILDIQEQGLGLIRLKESYRQFCPQIQEMYEAEYRKSFVSELNSVYVALTRAVEELYVFVPSRVGSAVNPAKFLIPPQCLAMGAPTVRQLAPARAHGKERGSPRIAPFVSDAWSHLQQEFSDQPSSAVLARQGEFYHAVLMNILDLGAGVAGAVDAAWEAACRLLAPCGERGAVLRAMAEFLERADVRPFFEVPAQALVFCEKEFVNAAGDSRRIDRLIVEKERVRIVDFKLSPEGKEKHEKQMKEYVEIVREFYPGRQISGHILYFEGGK